MTESDPPAVVLHGRHPFPASLGGKGAALDRLIAGSIPVPPTGVVTTVAYREFVGVPEIGALLARIRSGEPVSPEEVDAVFSAVPVPAALAEEIVGIARRVGAGARLAVRSSATVEDLADSSFAGQYRSLLDVDAADADAVLAAVRLVFASLWHPAPCAYRTAFGIDDADVAMAAVLMRMVPAERAGVVFTEDPGSALGTGSGVGLARVEAVDGLGESLVSGERTPEAWLVGRDLVGFDGPDEIATALRYSLQIEDVERQPQDVEWAFDGDTVWIVQARPITVGGGDDGDGFDSPLDAEELTTAGIGEMLPGVLPPLRWQIASHLVNEAFARLVTELGAGSPDSDPTRFVRRVRGRAAMDLDVLKDLATQLPGGSAEELEVQYFGSRRPGRPAAPARPDSSRWAILRHDLRTLAVQRRSALDAEIVVHAVSELGDGPEIGDLDRHHLAAYQFRLIDLAVRATAAELAVAASASSSYRKIELILAPHLGEVEAGRWAERVTSSRGLTVAPHRAASAAVFAGPTWDELGRRPPSVDDLRRDTAVEPEEIEATLFDTLRATKSWGHGGLRAAMRTRALRQLINETATLLHRREASKAALLLLGGHVRRTMLEQGRRLVARGDLEEPGEIELLTLAEIARSFAGHGVAPNTISRRRRWWHRYEAEPPLPLRFVGMPEREPVALPAGGRLDGWAASPGRFTGTARVVRDPADSLEKGAILVAAATDASWSPLFLRAGAIVVDRGGPLSHAAILARELGVPAVLNVQNASRVLDGETLTVDGDSGIVVIHEAGDTADGTAHDSHGTDVSS